MRVSPDAKVFLNFFEEVICGWNRQKSVYLSNRIFLLGNSVGLLKGNPKLLKLKIFSLKMY